MEHYSSIPVPEEDKVWALLEVLYENWQATADRIVYEILTK